MQERQKFEIDGQEYEFYYIQPSKALTLGARIAKMIAGPIGAAFDSGSIAGVLDTDINIGRAFKEIAVTDEKEFASIVKELLGSVRLGTGMEFNVDIHFEGKIRHMMNVAIKALEYNFADFFGDLREKLGGFVRRVAPSDTTQGKQTATGFSGESSSQGSPRSKK